jgi:hypothetical protein
MENENLKAIVQQERVRAILKCSSIVIDAGKKELAKTILRKTGVTKSALSRLYSGM